MMKFSGIAVAAAAMAASACATEGYNERAGDPSVESARASGPDPRVGREVSRICFPRNIDGFKVADGYDRAVLLEEGVNDWYLVQLSGACRSRDFRFANVIALENRPSGGCVTRGDVIIVSDNGTFNNRCFINQINEWDDDAPAPGDEEWNEDDGY